MRHFTRLVKTASVVSPWTDRVHSTAQVIATEVYKNTTGQALAVGAEIGLVHDQRQPLPAGEFTSYLKTETQKLSGKEHVRYNFTGAAEKGSRYPGTGQ
jgi:hypothetical protein